MTSVLRRWWLTGAIALIPVPAMAEIDVAVTMAPIHSLVSMVTEGVLEPALIVKPGASPHGHAMRPSEARALDGADVVFWLGDALEPWMAKALDSLAANATVINLSAAEGVTGLGVREGGDWGLHDHAGQESSDENLTDPHLWLDPDNGIAWLQTMAATLAAIDPEHAGAYLANAKRGADRLNVLTSKIEKGLAPVKEKPYIVFHDAYQYFERRFALHAVGSISLGDADRPSAARLVEIRRTIEESGAVCAFSEPQFEPKLLDTAIEGSSVKKAVLDPIGADLEPGAGLYPSLLERMATSLIDCLSP